MQSINTDGKLLHERLCYEIRGAIFDVSNKYGKGLKEIVYQNALEEELDIRKIPFEKQKKVFIKSISSGKTLGVYIPDLVVDGKVIVEIKAAELQSNAFLQQQLSYLKASKYEVGLLVNFCTPELSIKRLILTNDRKGQISANP